MELREFSAAFREIFREHFAVSDRGLILVISSTLDELTQQLLRSLFVPDEKTIENLLGIDRPLGTFSSRINISFCIGAIRRDQFEDLHTIRKMRNECAHSFRSVSLSSDPLRVECLLAANVYCRKIPRGIPARWRGFRR